MSRKLRGVGQTRLGHVRSSNPCSLSVQINEVRRQTGPVADKFPSLFSDASILRFLRARNWNTKKTTKMLKETLKWQLEFKPIRWEDIAHEAETVKVYRANYFDKQRRSVVIMRPGFQMVKPLLEQKTYKKVKFVYSNDPRSIKIMESLFDMDKVESAFGGKNTAGFDCAAYAKRMKEEDKKMSDFINSKCMSPSVMSELQHPESVASDEGGSEVSDEGGSDFNDEMLSGSEGVDEKIGQESLSGEDVAIVDAAKEMKSSENA